MGVGEGGRYAITSGAEDLSLEPMDDDAAELDEGAEEDEPGVMVALGRSG